MASKFPLFNITSPALTSPTPVPIFGLQDALVGTFDAPAHSGQWSLFPNACKQSDGSQNCTTTCLDVSKVFENMATLHNCRVWPTVYVQYAKDNLSPNNTRLAAALGADDHSLNTGLPSRIINSIQKCFLDSCASDPECRSNAGKFQQKYKADLTGDAYYNTSAFFDLCPNIASPAIADVAGIGVR